mgnify:CR=1 FL=1
MIRSIKVLDEVVVWVYPWRVAREWRPLARRRIRGGGSNGDPSSTEVGEVGAESKMTMGAEALPSGATATVPDGGAIAVTEGSRDGPATTVVVTADAGAAEVGASVATTTGAS